MRPAEGLLFRSADASYAGAIAALHADSWRRHYRGAYSDVFLDGDVDADRLAAWTERLREPDPNTHTIVAVDSDGVVGFAHTVFEADPRWGALIDNLHVVHDQKRRGIGSHLLAMTADAVLERGTGLYLWVLEQNLDARAFYEARAGQYVERLPVPAPAGMPGRLNGSPFGLRYAWPDPAVLLGSAQAQASPAGTLNPELEMRPLLAGDAAAIHHTLLSDPEIAGWFRSDGIFTLSECEEMVARKLAHRAAHGFGWSLAWEGDICIGWSVAQYCIVDGGCEVEIGWTVARSHWRRGIATALGRQAITEVSSLGLGSIVAYARQDNLASHGVMAKLGMTFEKSFDFHGQPHVLYRLSPPRP